MFKFFASFQETLRFPLVCLLLLAPLQDAEAKNGGKKNSKNKPTQESPKGNKNKPAINISKIVSIEVNVKIGKKEFPMRVDCYDKDPGTLRITDKKTSFTTFDKQIDQLEDKVSTPRIRKKLAELKKLMKIGNTECKKERNTPNFIPENLSLDPYTGPFGLEEAKLLYDRFAFGAKEGQAEVAAQEGLAKTVDYMTTYVYDQALEQAVGDLACDGELEAEGDKDDRACQPEGVYLPGVRYGIYRRVLRSEKPFFEKLFFFLHDERMATGASDLDSEELYVVNPHVALLRRAATSGDYRQFMRDWNNDDLGHRIWLDGGVNNGFNPNQNYAREFWELGTTGPSYPDGRPVYDDQDIEQASLAFSGRWNSYHAAGPKVIFHGTPYERTVENAEDVLNATFDHPRTAIHLAEDIWKEFIGPITSDDEQVQRQLEKAIERLADEIRKEDFKLIPVFKTLMKSKALYHADNRKTLLKHANEIVLGFLRQTGIPASYQLIDNKLKAMGELPLDPPTVFGWYEEKLAAESHVYDTYNALVELANDTNQWKKTKYTLLNLVRVDDPNVTKTRIVVDRIVSRLNLNLDEPSRQLLVGFLDYNLLACTAKLKAAGACVKAPNSTEEYFWEKNLFFPTAEDDLSSDNPNYKIETQYLLKILTSLPDYKAK